MKDYNIITNIIFYCMDLIQGGVSVTGSKKKNPLRQSQGGPGMGLAAAAAGRCSLHLYMIAKHKFGDVTKFRIIISNKPRNPRKTSILPRRYGLSLLFCPFISKLLLFLIHFVYNRVGVVPTPSSRFIFSAKLRISSESDSDSDILSYRSCLVFL